MVVEHVAAVTEELFHFIYLDQFTSGVVRRGSWLPHVRVSSVLGGDKVM